MTKLGGVVEAGGRVVGSGLGVSKGLGWIWLIGLELGAGIVIPGGGVD